MNASAALVVGCGALGCTTLDALARAGVGRLIIVDRDLVELTNLQRQTLYDEQDAVDGVPKAAAAAKRIRAVNSAIDITAHIADLNARNAESFCRGVQVVVDCTDNFQTRYLLNDVCVKLGLPLAYAGVLGTAGMSMTIIPGVTPCLRCIFPEPPPAGSSPTCDTAGVLGPMVGVIASIQAAEAMKILLGCRDLVRSELRQIDIWSGQFRSIDLSGVDRAGCPCCGQRRFDFLEGERADSQTTSLCGSNAVQILPLGAVQVDLATLGRRLSPHGQFSVTPHLLRGSLRQERDLSAATPIELTVFGDGRAIVKGTLDPTFARTIYAKYIGT